MFPVPALAQQIEREWASEIASFDVRPPEKVTTDARPWLRFPAGVLRIELMDGSEIRFSYAFYVVSEVRRTIAVFTEHCGHHLYPYHEAKIYRDDVLVYEQV
ncbi:MAG: hypothetical protein CFE44_06810 [Burkholderiales bacterium PBB4]|nr:MAG: hypothetical protein CFE44_06810 [Burkholderiales bacterium PBB4]